LKKEELPMPYVHIQITREGATVEQKTELIRGKTELLVRVLDAPQRHGVPAPRLPSASRLRHSEQWQASDPAHE
jgi:hypothetical protein